MLPDWLQVSLALITVIGSIFGSVVAVSFRSGARLTKVDAAIEANAVAIGELTKAVADRATAETARGLQAQLTRQEGALATHVVELTARLDRHGVRVDKMEEAHAVRETATAAILGRLESGFASLKESVERLIIAEADQRRHPPAARFGNTEIMAALTLAVQAAPLVRQMLERKAA